MRCLRVVSGIAAVSVCMAASSAPAAPNLTGAHDSPTGAMTHRAAAVAATGPGSGFGSLLLSGSSWLGSHGVDVMSNGSIVGWCCGASSGYGIKWQCVELPQRLYNQKGWYSRTTFAGVGVATDIYTVAIPG